MVVALDGRSAYDCISRADVLSKLRYVAPSVLPFARMQHARDSTLLWWGDAGHVRDIRQAEGLDTGPFGAGALCTRAA